MAAITFVGRAKVDSGQRIRTVVAQATTGQTDWVPVPPDAVTAQVIINCTATNGTTPILTPSILEPLPGTPTDDSGAVAMETAPLTGITSTGTAIINIGQDIASETTGAASGVSDYGINKALPQALGIKVLNDRTTGDETYTYTVDVIFRRR